ncbi:MAG: hypothetical protein H0W00_03670 [Chloroflexi bacterium]|nr:hypothetical protein [Chloroflexota bacterium]
MIPLICAGLAALGALSVLLARGWPRGAGLAGATALIAVTAAAALAPLEAPVALGDAFVTDAPMIRLWLTAVAGALALLIMIALLVAPSSGLPMLACVIVATTALSLTLSEPAAALTLSAGTGILGLAGAGALWRGPFRQSALVPGLAAGGTLLAPLAATGSSVLILPAMLVAGAVLLRVGAIPFHLLPLRAARTGPLTMIVLMSVWAPYLFGLLAAAWLTTGPAASVFEDPAVRDALAVLGGTTVVLAAVAMLVQKDLGSLMGVHAIGDGALVLLALAGGAAAMPALASWLIVSGLARTVLAGWSIAAASRMGSRQVDGTRGWIRRAPLLLPALVVPIVAGVGWPGSVPFEARRVLVEGAVPETVALLVVGASMALGLGYARLMWAGLRQADDESAVAVRPRTRAGRWSAAALVLSLGLIPLVTALGIAAPGFTEPGAASADWRPFDEDR